MRKNYALIRARKEKELTQQMLAELMDCQKTTISNWENGYARPNLADAFKLSKILEKRLDSLFFNTEVQESHTFN
ncbi:helix-turn-helix transcriptional regulator [Parafrankia elaeagni]|uniref:helix-turn-helix transcriptional regulator n=1 Tax=Parafrankia elaeagni TaxID=222534 RepID=UPI00047561D3|nr:helix-turn-helix transcriptional regulator [Parafrankia elaeagni]